MSNKKISRDKVAKVVMKKHSIRSRRTAIEQHENPTEWRKQQAHEGYPLKKAQKPSGESIRSNK